MARAKTSTDGAASDIAAGEVTTGILPYQKGKRGRKRTLKDYQPSGVLLSPDTSPVYKPMMVRYEGILARNGADEVYAYAGIGDAWDNRQDIKMTKRRGNVFEATLLAVETLPLNICFHDSANNWDNNANQNYVFKGLQ